MMSDNCSLRLFGDDADIRSLGQGLLDRSLPRACWTHEAHLAATLWLIRERPDIALERELPGIISRYNVTVGGENSDSAGYHETITQFYIRRLRAHAAAAEAGEPLAALVNRALLSPLGARDYLLRYYSRSLLFSVEARRRWVEPDLVSRI